MCEYVHVCVCVYTVLSTLNTIFYGCESLNINFIWCSDFFSPQLKLDEGRIKPPKAAFGGSMRPWLDCVLSFTVCITALHTSRFGNLRVHP